MNPESLFLRALEPKDLDLLFEIENEVLEIKLGNDVASELGPLKYLAEVTGMSMDDIMKWFIFLLIIIGDPMAILMVIIFNKVANIERQSREKDIEISIIPSEIKEEIKEDKEEIEELEEEIEEIEEEIEEIEEEIEEEIKEGDKENDEVLERLKRLEEKERIIKEKEDDVKRLNKEIKDWENTHWKLKRNRKPPSV